MKHEKTSQAFSLIEILIGFGILAFALIPIVTMTQSSSRTSSFTEFHVFWQARIARIHASVNQWDYSFLLSRRNSDGLLALTFAEPAIPEEYSRMLKFWKEEVRFEELEAGIGRLTVTIRWSFPLDKPGGGHRHRMVSSRLIADAGRSWRIRDELLLGGGS